MWSFDLESHVWTAVRSGPSALPFAGRLLANPTLSADGNRVLMLDRSDKASVGFVVYDLTSDIATATSRLQLPFTWITSSGVKSLCNPPRVCPIGYGAAFAVDAATSLISAVVYHTDTNPVADYTLTARYDEAGDLWTMQLPAVVGGPPVIATVGDWPLSAACVGGHTYVIGAQCQEYSPLLVDPFDAAESCQTDPTMWRFDTATGSGWERVVLAAGGSAAAFPSADAHCTQVQAAGDVVVVFDGCGSSSAGLYYFVPSASLLARVSPLYEPLLGTFRPVVAAGDGVVAAFGGSQSARSPTEILASASTVLSSDAVFLRALSCPPGTAPNDKGGCTLCAAGTFSAAFGSDPCEPCAGGAAPLGATDCSGCPNGTEPAADASGCLLCPPGSYASLDAGCQTCPAGRYTPTAGLSACLPCEPGESQASDGAIGCSACLPPFEFADDFGLETCSLCSVAGAELSEVGATSEAGCQCVANTYEVPCVCVWLHLFSSF